MSPRSWLVRRGRSPMSRSSRFCGTHEIVEAIPDVTAGRTAPGRFLFNATVGLLEQYGFQRRRQVGKPAWIVSRVVEPA